jgi:dihydrofolate reductase
MRKIIASTFVSADGYMVGPNEDMSWVMNNFSLEMGEYAGGLMSSMDTVLIGRVTYQVMINFWPAQTEATAPGADGMNKNPKIVLSRTLDQAPWGDWAPARVLKADVEQELKSLKGQPGKNIVIYGSANVVQNLTQMGLIDEYQLLVFPILLGAGKPLFRQLPHRVPLKRLRLQAFENGVTVEYYAPDAK